MTSNEHKVALKRGLIESKIGRNPFWPEFIYRQFYIRADDGSMVKDGNPVLVKGLKSPVRIFMNMKNVTTPEENGVISQEEGAFLVAMHDEEIYHGMIFEYFGRKYKTGNPVYIIKYGEKVGVKCELVDVTQEVVYAD